MVPVEPGFCHLRRLFPHRCPRLPKLRSTDALANMYFAARGGVAGSDHKLSERLRVEHVRFEGGPLRLKLSPPLLRGSPETDVVTESEVIFYLQLGLGVPIYPDACP